MHLLTFMKLRAPGMAFRAAVLAGQGARGGAAAGAAGAQAALCRALRVL